jgi:hypothetical protein
MYRVPCLVLFASVSLLGTSLSRCTRQLEPAFQLQIRDRIVLNTSCSTVACCALRVLPTASADLQQQSGDITWGRPQQQRLSSIWAHLMASLLRVLVSALLLCASSRDACCQPHMPAVIPAAQLRLWRVTAVNIATGSASSAVALLALVTYISLPASILAMLKLSSSLQQACLPLLHVHACTLALAQHHRCHTCAAVLQAHHTQQATPTLPSPNLEQRQAPIPLSSRCRARHPATLPRHPQAIRQCQLAAHQDLMLAHPQ